MEEEEKKLLSTSSLDLNLSEILNEPLFVALDDKRRAQDDDALPPAGELELDFGFGEVDLQKIMEEEILGSSSSPIGIAPARSTASPSMGSPFAFSASSPLSSSPSLALATSPPSSSTSSAPQTARAASSAPEPVITTLQSSSPSAVADAGGVFVLDEETEAEPQKHAADGEELTPDNSLIKEITDSIEGRYLESLSELKRQQELSNAHDGIDVVDTDAEAEVGRLAAGEEMSQEIIREIENELVSASPDLDKVRELVRTHVLPDSLRPALWKLLLGVEKKSEDSMAGWEEVLAAPLTAEEEKLVQACRDTRPELPEFREDAVAQRLSRVLRFFCKRRYVKYREGMPLNEVLAPFLMLNYQLGVAFNCFDALISKYLPLTFVEDPSVHSCVNQLFRLLVLYHDQPLCLYLDQNKLSHFSFCSKWFSSLFACIYDMEDVFVLWDFIFAHGDPFLPYYFGLAFLLDKRPTLLTLTSQQAILSELTRVPLSSAKDIQRLLRQALKLERRTPRAFRHQFYASTFQTQEWQSWVKRYLYTADSALATPTCLHSSALDVLDMMQSKDPRYLLIDVRTEDEFRSGHLPTAFHLPYVLLLERPEEFKRLLEGFAQLKSDTLHFIFMGAAHTETFLELTVLQFLQKGFNHVSVAHGGYEALHEVLLTKPVESLSQSSTARSSTEIMDHDASRCLVCKAGPAPNSTPSLTSSFFSALLSSSSAPKYNDRTAYNFSSSPPASTPSTSPPASQISSSPSHTAPSVPSTETNLPPAASSPPTASTASLLSSSLSLPTSLVSSFTSGISRVREKAPALATRMPNIPFSLSGRVNPLASVAVDPSTTVEMASTSKPGDDPNTEKPSATRFFTIDDEEDEGSGTESANTNGDNDVGTEAEEHQSGKTKESASASKHTHTPEASKDGTQASLQDGAGAKKPTTGRWGLFSWGRQAAREDAAAALSGSETASDKPNTSEPESKPATAPTPEGAEKHSLWRSFGLSRSALSFWGGEKRPQHRIGEYVRLDQYVEAHQAWSFFACKILVEPTVLHPWYLVVTSDELLELKVHDEKRYLVAVERVHSLGNIVKITFKKRTPKLLTFLFAPEGVDVAPAAQTTASQRSSEGSPDSSSSQEAAVPTDAPPEEPKPQQSEPIVITTRFIVERPNECIATVTRAAEAFFKRQDSP